MDHILGKIFIDSAPDFYLGHNTDARLNDLLREGVEVVVSLREREPLAGDYRILNMTFYHIPVQDFDVPTPAAVCEFIRVIEDNMDRKILVHCHAGLGRSGTMMALYLKYRGMAGKDAIRFVRRYRPGAIETPEQEAFVINYDFSVFGPDADRN